MLFDYLPRCYQNGQTDLEAREMVGTAATMAGMAFANAFLGIGHSLAHKLGAYHNIVHGIANALVIDDYYLVIPGVFKMDGDYILIGRKNKNIERFDQYMRNCLCEMGFTKTPNYEIKPLEKFGIDKVFSIEGLNLYDNKTFDDVKEFINNVFIPGLKNHDEKYKQYYFVLNENEYNHFCKTEVSKIDKDVSKLNTKQIKDYIKIKYDVSLDMTFLTLLNIDNNPYNDIESILTYMCSYLSEGTCKLLVKEYDKVNNNYMLEKTICEWLCISKDEKNEEVSLF
jgi:hypothetical protein